MLDMRTRLRWARGPVYVGEQDIGEDLTRYGRQIRGVSVPAGPAVIMVPAPPTEADRWARSQPKAEQEIHERNRRVLLTSMTFLQTIQGR